MTYAQAYHPRHYEAFKTGEAAKGEGTPIEELPFLTAARRAELKALHIHTAEALSQLEKLARHSPNLGMFGRELKEKTAYRQGEGFGRRHEPRRREHEFAPADRCIEANEAAPPKEKDTDWRTSWVSPPTTSASADTAAPGTSMIARTTA